MPDATYTTADHSDVLLINGDGLRFALKAGDPMLAGLTIAPYAPVPDLTPLQLRQGLLAAGMLEQVEALVAAGPVALRLTYQHASLIQRGHPMIAALAEQIGLSSEAVDELFRAAATG